MVSHQCPVGERFAGPGQGALHGHTPGASDEPSGDEEDHAAYASEGACLPYVRSADQTLPVVAAVFSVCSVLHFSGLSERAAGFVASCVFHSTCWAVIAHVGLHPHHHFLHSQNLVASC